MKLRGIELRRVSMPLVSPFRTSFGTQTERDILLLKAVTDDAEGWGECVAPADPLYSSEYVGSQVDVLRHHLLPRLSSPEGQAAIARSGAGAIAGLTHPIVLDDGHIAVPTGPGLGVTPVPEVLDSVTRSVEWIVL
ncbi:hypothetical protein ACWDA3_23105 [Nonomuraea rubra]